MVTGGGNSGVVEGPAEDAAAAASRSAFGGTRREGKKVVGPLGKVFWRVCARMRRSELMARMSLQASSVMLLLLSTSDAADETSFPTEVKTLVYRLVTFFRRLMFFSRNFLWLDESGGRNLTRPSPSVGAA